MASLFLALITIVGFWINYLLNFVRVYLAGKRIRRLLKEMFSSGSAKRWTRIVLAKSVGISMGCLHLDEITSFSLL